MKYSSLLFITILSFGMICTPHFTFAETIKAAAYLSPVDKDGSKRRAYGYVIFEQESMANTNNKNTNPVKVDVSGLMGFPKGDYGFHIHQYGDMIQPGTHFIPICTEPDPTVTPATKSSCEDDVTHGFPLTDVNNKYQAGDLGNIRCYANGGCKICICTANPQDSEGVDGAPSKKYNPPTCVNCEKSYHFKGEKFTLQPPPPSVTDDIDRSVVGRALVVHAKVDNGGPPFGDAGPAMSRGVIGPVALDTGNTLSAEAPRNPPISSLICAFDEYLNTEYTDQKVKGEALIMISNVNNINGDCEMHAEITGLKVGEHSFHFHAYSTNLSDPNSQVLGPIYNGPDPDKNQLEVKTLNVKSATGKAIFEAKCSLSELYFYAGRSLTIHKGPSINDPTIAVAVCGMANPDTCFEESTGPVGCLKGMNVADSTDTSANTGSLMQSSMVTLSLSILIFSQLLLA